MQRYTHTRVQMMHGSDARHEYHVSSVPVHNFFVRHVLHSKRSPIVNNERNKNKESFVCFISSVLSNQDRALTLVFFFALFLSQTFAWLHDTATAASNAMLVASNVLAFANALLIPHGVVVQLVLQEKRFQLGGERQVGGIEGIPKPIVLLPIGLSFMCLEEDGGASA
jgi:hypothetical protein